MMKDYQRVEHNVVDIRIIRTVVQNRNHLLRILLVEIIKPSYFTHKKIIAFTNFSFKSLKIQKKPKMTIFRAFSVANIRCVTDRLYAISHTTGLKPFPRVHKTNSTSSYLKTSAIMNKI